MRITTRMTAALALAGLVVFGVYGAKLLDDERRTLVASTEREVTLLAASLRVSVENALRDRQLEDVDETVLRLEELDRSVDVFLYGTDGARLADPATGAPEPRLEALVRAAIETGAPSVVVGPLDGAGAALVAVPLLDDDDRLLGALGLVRPLDDARADLAATRQAVVGSVLTFVTLATALGLLLGTWTIRRPLERLAAAMRRVREGELAPALGAWPDDEVGGLAREFEAMLGELRLAREQLAVAAERRRELVHALQQADKLVTIGQLSASLAHEIGSPLQVLHGRARALSRRPDDVEKTRTTAEILVRETERISRIVDRLLAVTRTPPRRVDDVDVEAAAREVVELFEVEARRRGVGLAVRSAPGAPSIRADGDQVRQVVLNLVSNALAACGRGGSVAVEVAPSDGGVRICVVDDGAGMDDLVRARAFEPFFTTRPLEGGRGLGLAVVRAVVTEHGGRVTVDSAPGEGTRVTVELSAAPERLGGEG